MVEYNRVTRISDKLDHEDFNASELCLRKDIPSHVHWDNTLALAAHHEGATFELWQLHAAVMEYSIKSTPITTWWRVNQVTLDRLFRTKGT